MNTEPTASSSSRILVVDDDLVIRQTVAMALKKAGYQVSIAADISAALTAARREKPDLILLDITFPLDPTNVGGPSRDGLFIIDWFQRTPETKIVPIIIISGTDQVKYKDQISPEGIVAWFRKPLNHEELLAAMKTALDRQVTTAPPISSEI
jgi:DNA-binding response OmpR family regulator